MLFSLVEESRGSPDTIDHEETLLTSSPTSDMATEKTFITFGLHIFYSSFFLTKDYIFNYIKVFINAY